MSIAAEARGGGGAGRGGASPLWPRPAPGGARAAMRAAGPGPGSGSAPAPAARPPRRNRGRGPRRARASFVDESLFGSPAGARPPPPGFAPPWAAGPVPVPGDSAPRPRSKSRSGSHTPSFCDESLFGAKPRGPAWAAPGMRKEDVAKLHALLWSPPPAARNPPGLSPRTRETPLRALRSPAPTSPAAAALEGGRKGQSCPWKRPESGSCSEGRGGPSRGRSQSLSRLNTPSNGLHLASETPKTERCKHQSLLTAPATPRGPLMRGRSKSVSGPPLARSSMAVGSCKPRPPWK
ncbi:LOW QUALITY PROTEIN: RBPJ-interacting and tubulin-associated protein 1 [Numenius arquata]|uniref:LOW QUALITY PROTEIN: RBPJ-interacting and tubulin-associated protein 1 n=1 Tax=Numenius arquata TaxID=31919 RepID=UPI003D306CCF